MRKAFVNFAALVAFSFIAAPAMAGTVSIGGTHSRDEIKTTCEKNGGTMDNVGVTPGGYGCIGKSGTVMCNKDGKCAGVCENCGGKAASKGAAGGILTNAPGKKPQPLTPQNVTRSPGTAPSKPITSQKVTRSPKAASRQPVTQQKITAASNARPMAQSASQSSRKGR
jgi:hypothetical protein